MPKKRESTPVQVWLKNSDCVRLKNAAKFTSRSQSDIAREAIIRALDELEIQEKSEELEKQLFDGYSAAAKNVMECAEQEARRLESPAIGTAILLLALTADSSTNVGKLLNHAGVSWNFVKSKVGRMRVYDVRPIPKKIDPSENCIRVLVRARIIAQRLHDVIIQPEHILLSLLEDYTEGAYNILQIAGVDYAELREKVMKSRPKVIIRRTRTKKRELK